MFRLLIGYLSELHSPEWYSRFCDWLSGHASATRKRLVRSKMKRSTGDLSGVSDCRELNVNKKAVQGG